MSAFLSHLIEQHNIDKILQNFLVKCKLDTASNFSLLTSEEFLDENKIYYLRLGETDAEFALVHGIPQDSVKEYIDARMNLDIGQTISPAGKRFLLNYAKKVGLWLTENPKLFGNSEVPRLSSKSSSIVDGNILSST